MQYTQNYQLRKPTRGLDVADVNDENYNMDKIDELINDSQNSIGEAYDTTETYNTGDCAMYDGLLYECQEDGVTGAWDATKWARTTATAHGTGGSSVEPNPQGTPTDDLDTIGINGTIYNIAGSGGGGNTGVFIEEVLWEGSQTSSSDITLDKPYTDYDFIQVIGTTSGGFEGYGFMIPVREITQNTSLEFINNNITNTNRRFIGYFASSTTISIQTLEGFEVNKVIGIETSGSYFNPIIYSTEEREVGVWIDNKTLYQKSYSLNTAIRITNSGTNITSYIDNESVIEHIVNASGNNTSTAENQATNLWVGRGSSNLLAYNAEGSDVDVITLWYTKTTDTAGSGSYNSLGVPMVHYSTDEHVIGTDESGNTIYEKTLPTVTLTSTNTQTDISTLNIDEIIDIKARYKQGNGNIQFVNEYNDGEDWLSTQISSNNIRTLCKAWFVNNGFTAKYTLQYTKSSS